MKHRLLAAAAATLVWTLVHPLDARAQSASDFEALKKEVERLRLRALSARVFRSMRIVTSSRQG